jgi:hypothetical protein
LVTDLGGDARRFFIQLADFEADLLVNVSAPLPDMDELPECWKRLLKFGHAIVTKFYLEDAFRGFQQPVNSDFVLPHFCHPVSTPAPGSFCHDILFWSAFDIAR